MTCADCKYWNAGECRRFPPALHDVHFNPDPTVNAILSSQGGVTLKSFWPVTRAEDWCGEVTE